MRIATHCVVVLAAVLAAACAPSGPPPVEIATPETEVAPGLENGSFFATLNGFEIHYEVHGSGPVLMALPNSWGLSLEGLRAMYRPLEEKLTMVYFDPRGMGKSSAVVDDTDMSMEAVRADFQALREHLGFDSVSAIGWSNGAMNLIELASESPDTVSAAIFVHGAASFGEEDAALMAQNYPDLMAKWVAFETEMQTNTGLSDEERTAMMRTLWLEDWFPESTGDPAGAAALFDLLFGEAEFSWAHADYTNKRYPTFDARDRLPLITARSLVVAGAHDMFSVDKVRELADGIPDAEFVAFESSGHFAPAEEVEAFREAVFGFLGVE